MAAPRSHWRHPKRHASRAVDMVVPHAVHDTRQLGSPTAEPRAMLPVAMPDNVIRLAPSPLGYSWHEVARTFDAIQHWGNMEACSEVGDDVDSRIYSAISLIEFTTVELRTYLYFAAWAEAASEPYDSPVATKIKENVVRELVRRHGKAWLDGEIRKVRANPRPPTCPECASFAQVVPYVHGHPAPHAFRPPDSSEFWMLGDAEATPRRQLWICQACGARF